MLKDNLAAARDGLLATEAAARKLQNQNFADIAKSAIGKMSQLLTHPDIEKVAELHGDAPEAGHDLANLIAFQAELAALARSGDDQSPRAQELRVLIGQLQTESAKVKSVPLPATQPQPAARQVNPDPIGRAGPPASSGPSFGP